MRVVRVCTAIERVAARSPPICAERVDKERTFPGWGHIFLDNHTWLLSLLSGILFSSGRVNFWSRQMNPRERKHQHEKFTISVKPSLTEDQQEKAIELLKEAWGIISFWDWNGTPAQAIVSFVNEVEGHTDWPKDRPTPKY